MVNLTTSMSPRYILSQLFFSWLNPVFHKGFAKNVLETDDLHDLNEENKAEYQTKILYDFWYEETRKGEQNAPRYKPSIGRAVWRCYRKSLLHSAFYTTIESAARVAQALLIGLLVTGLAEGSDGIHRARLQYYVAALCFVSYTYVITLHRGQFLGKLFGMRLRVSLTGLIYKKVFKLTQSSVSFFTTGHVINLISNDVRKFDNFFRSFHYLWLAPLELIVTTYLVWEMIGWLALAASVFLVLFIPILAFIGKQSGKLHLKVSALTDRRVRLTGEILSGIRAVKMYIWEMPMSEMVEKLRRLELKKIRWLSVLQAGIVIIYFLTMVLLSLLLYTGLVAEGHFLTADHVFTTMLLYSNIKHSLCGHFGLQMNYTLQGLASLKRIQRFLVYEEKHVAMSFENPVFSVLRYIFPQKEIQNVVPDNGLYGTFKRIRSQKVPQKITGQFIDDPFSENNSDEVDNNDAYKNDENSVLIFKEGSSTESIDSLTNDNSCDNFIPNKVNKINSNNNNNGNGPDSEQNSAFLQVQDATCYWDGTSSQPCLNNINFNLSSGALLAVTGPIGSGKSSLLMSILGEMRPTAGKIKQQGRVVYAPQNPWVFTGTVRENILFGLPYDHDRYQKVLAACQLTEDVKMFPSGDSTFIGERGTSLSGGQRARVSLARAVYHNADIYLLDDPLSSLDIQVGKKLFEKCIKGLLKNNLVILVTHHLSYLREADRIMLMRDGNMVAEGSYEEIQKAGIDLFSVRETFSATPYLPRKPGAVPTVNQARTKLRRPLSVGIERVVEKRMTGSVPLSLYWKYFEAGNSTMSLVTVCLLLVASQVILKLSEWWLACWTDLPYKRQQDNYNIYVFVGFTSLYVVLSFVGGILHFQNYLNSNGCLHDNMIKSVVRAPLMFFDTNPTGRIQNRFSKDLGLMDQELPCVGFKFFFSLINCIGSVLLVAAVQYWALIAAIPLVVVFIILGRYYVRTTREVKRLEASSRSPVYSHLSETLQGLTSIQCFKAEDRFTETFYSYQDEHTRAWLTYIAGGEWLGVRAEILTATFLAAASIAAVTTSADAGFTGLALYSAASLTQIIYLAVHNSTQFESLMTSVERVMEYGNLAPEPGYYVEGQFKTQCQEEGSISCENLSLVYYDGGPTTLRDITFTVKPKEKVGVVGHTGSGKSSLLAALFRMPEAKGKVLIDGHDISTINLQSTRAAMSVIPQDPFLFGGELRANLDPFLQVDDATLWDVLDRVQEHQLMAAMTSGAELKQKVQSLPSQLDYKLHEAGANLSTGERQLICLARALIQKNKIIVIDEATANVDYETDRKIQQAIKQNFGECTTLTIAHRVDTIMDSDRVMVLSGGTVVEFDTTEVLLEKEDSAFAQLVRQQ